MPKELGNHPKIHHSTRLGDLKIRCGAKDLGAAAKVGEKGVALKVGEKTASHLTPLHLSVPLKILLQLLVRQM